MRLRSIRLGAAPIALTVLLTFGCTTVRVPASAIGSEVEVGQDGPEPQVELWLESGMSVSDQEKARAAAEVKAALERAAETLISDDGEALLVVRAQGIARTTSRRSNQQAAKVGIAIGAVAAVAIIVVALVAGKGGGGGHGGGAPRVGGARIAPHVPRVAPAAVPRFRLPAVAAGGRHHVYAPGSLGVHLEAVVPVPVQGSSQELIAVSAVTPPPEATGEPTDRPAVEPITLHLPPPRPLDLTHRKFFDKDLTRLELIVVDRGSGEPTWVKTVEGAVDPRDPAAVRVLLAGAIEDRDGWTSVAPPAR